MRAAAARQGVIAFHLQAGAGDKGGAGRPPVRNGEGGDEGRMGDGRLPDHHVGRDDRDGSEEGNRVEGADHVPMGGEAASESPGAEVA